MPIEDNIIYCVQVDESGRMENVHMLTPNRASKILENAIETMSRRKEI
jgi:hypothetical protein